MGIMGSGWASKKRGTENGKGKKASSSSSEEEEWDMFAR